MRIEILDEATRDLTEGFRFLRGSRRWVGFAFPDPSLRRH